MKLSDFTAELYKQVQDFETSWDRSQRVDGLENWPAEMPEAEWWEHFLMFTEGEES